MNEIKKTFQKHYWQNIFVMKLRHHFSKRPWLALLKHEVAQKYDNRQHFLRGDTDWMFQDP